MGTDDPKAATAGLPGTMVNGDTVHRDAIERRLVSFSVDSFSKHRPDTVVQSRFPSGKRIHSLEN